MIVLGALFRIQTVHDLKESRAALPAFLLPEIKKKKNLKRFCLRNIIIIFLAIIIVILTVQISFSSQLFSDNSGIIEVFLML